MLLSFPKRGELKRFLCFCFGLCKDNPKQVLQAGFPPEISIFMAQFSGKWDIFTEKFGLLLNFFSMVESANKTALAQFYILGALVLAVRPWIAPFPPFDLHFYRWKLALLLAEYRIVPFSKLQSSVQWGCSLPFSQKFWGSLLSGPSIYLYNASVPENIIVPKQKFFLYALL